MLMSIQSVVVDRVDLNFFFRKGGRILRGDKPLASEE